MSRQLLSILTITILSQVVWAQKPLPGVDLWLPKSYQAHFLSLLETAKKVQREPECWQLLSGRLFNSKSTVDHPVFYFRCRNEQRRTFYYEVDSLSMEIISPHIEVQRLAAMEKEKIAKEEQRVELEKNRKRLWDVCDEQIKTKIKPYRQKTLLTELPAKPISIEESTHFIVDFDSLSLLQKTLRYRATCKINSLEDYSVKVKPRKIKK